MKIKKLREIIESYCRIREDAGDLAGAEALRRIVALLRHADRESVDAIARRITALRS